MDKSLKNDIYFIGRCLGYEPTQKEVYNFWLDYSRIVNFPAPDVDHLAWASVPNDKGLVIKLWDAYQAGLKRGKDESEEV